MEFPFKPTPSQAKLFQQLDTFILDKDATRHSFVLQGYAGTGKTSVCKELLKMNPKWKFSISVKST